MVTIKDCIETTDSEFEETFNLALVSLPDRIGKKKVEILLPILKENFRRDRIHHFTEGDPARIPQYILRVDETYENLNSYLHKVQIEKDERIWEDIFTQLSDWAMWFFNRKQFRSGRNNEDYALEQTSEAALVIMNAWFPYDIDFEPWSRVILNNCCLKFMRSFYRDAGYIPQSIDDLDETLSKLHTSKNREEIKTINEQLPQILEAINTLSPERKKVILYRYIENLSLDEIAKKMNKSLPAIYTLHFRALDDMRKILKEMGIY
jgi:RNA polymerase sigma factor (sigma-70 family)